MAFLATTSVLHSLAETVRRIQATDTGALFDVVEVVESEQRIGDILDARYIFARSVCLLLLEAEDNTSRLEGRKVRTERQMRVLALLTAREFIDAAAALTTPSPETGLYAAKDLLIEQINGATLASGARVLIGGGNLLALPEPKRSAARIIWSQDLLIISGWQTNLNV